jgi:type IV secretion system protein VirB11
VIERLIIIEDAKELILNNHPNHVRLFYSKGTQGLADKVADGFRHSPILQDK